MSEITIELNPQQITQAIEKLSIKDKLLLTERLERETATLRWKQVLSDIDARLKKFPISKIEVLKEIQAHRKQKHA